MTYRLNKADYAELNQITLDCVKYTWIKLFPLFVGVKEGVCLHTIYQCVLYTPKYILYQMIFHTTFATCKR